jgi:hypothetical protein
LTKATFLFLSSFSLLSSIFIGFTSKVKSSLTYAGICGKSLFGSIFAFRSKDA